MQCISELRFSAMLGQEPGDPNTILSLAKARGQVTSFIRGDPSLFSGLFSLRVFEDRSSRYPSLVPFSAALAFLP